MSEPAAPHDEGAEPDLAGPNLADLTDEERTALEAEVAQIAAEAGEGTGH